MQEHVKLLDNWLKSLPKTLSKMKTTVKSENQSELRWKVNNRKQSLKRNKPNSIWNGHYYYIGYVNFASDDLE